MCLVRLGSDKFYLALFVGEGSDPHRWEPHSGVGRGVDTMKAAVISERLMVVLGELCKSLRLLPATSAAAATHCRIVNGVVCIRICHDFV